MTLFFVLNLVSGNVWEGRSQAKERNEDEYDEED